MDMWITHKENAAPSSNYWTKRQIGGRWISWRWEYTLNVISEETQEARQIRIEHDTKNALNLKICIAAMRILLKPCHITIYTACDYMGNACRLGWVEKWQQDGWKKANGKPPANVEDWKQFFMLTQIHTVTFAEYDSRHDEELEKDLRGQ